MFFFDSQEPDTDSLLHGDPELDTIHPPPPCSQGHRSSLSLRTHQGGAICLLCFSNLVSDPRAPTLHVSYALSQLSLALSQSLFLHSLLSSHVHFLVSPLVHALSSFDDDPIANQIVDLITVLCSADWSPVSTEFIGRVADRLSSGALGWSRRQLYMLHCFGVLMNCQNIDLCAHIKDKSSLVCNLVAGLQLPSEEIRGEILFVLYKLATLQNARENGGGADFLSSLCPKLLYLSLEALAKTQRDDVRLNCIALLTILAQQGLFANSHANGENSMSCDEAGDLMQTTDSITDGPHLNVLFAESIKGPLLSTDSQVQISTLDLIFHYLSQESFPRKQIQVLIEENIADYAFEILRLSECKDPVVNSCLRILDLFSLAEQAFRQRLVVGFPSLIKVLRYVGEVPFHPFQIQTLKLVWNCVSDCPGVASSSHVKEIVLALSRMIERYYSQEMGLLPDAFAIVCSIFVALLRTPSFTGTPDLIISVQESLKHAILGCLSFFEKDSNQILHGLYLLKEVYAYCCEPSSIKDPSCTELRLSIIDVCTSHLLPWSQSANNETKEETTLGVMEMFHFILLQNSDSQVREYAKVLVSAAWFSFSFGCLGYFATEKTRWRVFSMLSSLVDIILGDNMGQPIRDAAPCLPSDPIDLLFLLGQESSDNSELSCCQSAVLLILHTSSLYNDRLADDKLVLASLEQYILVNRTSFIHGLSDSSETMQLVNLYGLYRGLQKQSYQIPYSPEVEDIIFHLLNESEWDLHSGEIHEVSLKWLFQQERISKALSYQILKFCRNNTLDGNQAHISGKSSHKLDIYRVAEMISEGDNYGPMLLVYLLIQLAEKEEQGNDVILVLNLMTTTICIFPAASDQLCLHSVGNAIHTLCCASIHSSYEQIMISLLPLMFNILISVHPEVLKNDESWVSATIKLLNCLSMREAVYNWNHEGLLVIGLLCLLLHHSSNGALTEASKSIVLNSSLASTISSVVDAACLKGPALSGYVEGTNIGDNLIFMLLLCFFSFRSLHAVLPGAVDWQSFFDPADKVQSLPIINIHCHDLCRLLHFGPALVKLIASYCLLELLTGLSEQMAIKTEKLKCSRGYIKSVMAVLEGLVFYDDIRVAMNCALCLSVILGWEDLEIDERRIIHKNKNWCKLILEEMSMSLAVPCSASNSFMNHHKPVVHVAVALLKLKNKPAWVISVFDDSCISGMIGNLAPDNISIEMVLLFGELLNSEFLNTEQIAGLNRVFQACRKQMYRNDPQDDLLEERVPKTISTVDDQVDVCKCLIHLMTSEPLRPTSFGRSQSQKPRLFDAIEQFFKTLTVEDGNS